MEAAHELVFQAGVILVVVGDDVPACLVDVLPGCMMHASVEGILGRTVGIVLYHAIKNEFCPHPEVSLRIEADLVVDDEADARMEEVHALATAAVDLVVLVLGAEEGRSAVRGIVLVTHQQRSLPRVAGDGDAVVQAVLVGVPQEGFDDLALARACSPEDAEQELFGCLALGICC